MPGAGHIDPKPTTYRGVRFRSRLEARWAVAFDICGWDWSYEPIEFSHAPTGWQYTPDFRVHKRLGSPTIWLEVKPTNVSDEYRHILNTFGSAIESIGHGPLYLVTGDWYQQNIVVQKVSPQKFISIRSFFGSVSPKHLATRVNRFRFDLR